MRTKNRTNKQLKENARCETFGAKLLHLKYGDMEIWRYGGGASFQLPDIQKPIVAFSTRNRMRTKNHTNKPLKVSARCETFAGTMAERVLVFECLVIEMMVKTMETMTAAARMLPWRCRGAAVLCCGCSPAHFDVDQRKVGWLTGRLAGHLFKIQGNAFLLLSSCFFMILSLRELQWGVRLINFHLFSLLKSIFKKISLRSIWIKQEAVEIDLKLIFLNIDLSKENK